MPEIIPNLHPLFVHFPIALISVSALFSMAAILIQNKTYGTYCAIVAHTMLWLGALTALFTVFFGWRAFNSVNHDEAGHAAMLVHRAWALGTLGVLVILAGWDVWHNKVDSSPAWWFAVAVIGAWSMTAITAWHGGELVYRHGLGVMSLPIAEAEHGHSHDAVMLDGDEHLHADGIPENQVHEHTHKVKEK